MTDRLSLEQLVHLSLGDPEVGAVNFNILKTLLLQMLQAMNLYSYKPAMSVDDQRALEEALSKQQQHVATAAAGNDNELKRRAERKKRDRSSDRLNNLEEKVFRFESQLNALDQLPANAELIDRAKDHQGPILEVWQYTQMEKRIESAENGITRVGALERKESDDRRGTSGFLARFVAARSSLGHERAERVTGDGATSYRRRQGRHWPKRLGTSLH